MTKHLLTFAFGCLALPAGVFGQAVYGSILGTVTDPTGAAVPRAKVIITDMDRQVSYETTTNESGNYRQPYLIAGRYRVRIEAQGFQTFVQENVVVSVDAATRVDAALRVGDVTEVIEVTGEAPLLKTDRTDVAIVFQDRVVSELPILNRRFTLFELLTPGVQPMPFQTAASEDPQGSFRKIVNGQHFGGTAHFLDGTDNHDAILGLIVINPTLESVTEAKITTSNYEAEFGQATAGVVSAQTRSGTNELHGSLFEFHRNSAHFARNPFTQARPITGTQNKYVPTSIWNQFGGSLGGPIRRNKAFFFGDYQGTKRLVGGSALVRVPTEAERRGDLSALGVNIFDPLSAEGQALTPDRRTQFPGNRIPASRLSPQAQNLLRYIPLPNIATAVGDQPNYVGSGTERNTEHQFNTRIDGYLSSNFHLFGRYSFADYAKDAPGIFGRVGGGRGFDAVSPFAGLSDVRNQSIAAGFDYTISPTLLTDFRFGWFRYAVRVRPGGLGTYPAREAGIPGLNVDERTSDMPAMFINGFAGFTFGYALPFNRCNCPLDQKERQFQFVNNWSKVRSNHTFKFGADIRRALNLRIPSDRHRSGQLNFNPERTAGAAGGGLGLASFLLGEVSSFERYVSSTFDAEERQNRWFFYGQDTWRVTPKLTLNYGLRWELYFPETVTGDRKGGWVRLSTGEVWVAGQDGVSRSGNVEATYRTLAPRLGIAYQLTPRTVIRTGYGRSFSIGVFGSLFGHAVTQNLPVLAIQALNPPNAFDRVFTLAEGPGPQLNPATLLDNRPKGATGKPILPPGISAFVRPERMRVPTVDNWNFTIQHQLTQDLAVEAAYVGNKGTHIMVGAGIGVDYDPNQPSVIGFGFLTTNQRRPFFPRYGWTQSLRYFGNDGSNHYHGLQLKAEKRFSQGWNLVAHYTWSRAINYDGVYYPHDPRVNRAIQDWNREHSFMMINQWEVPFGRGRRWLSNASRGVDLLLGGWQLNALTRWGSGLPFTPSYRDCGRDRDTGPCRPDIVGTISAAKASAPSQFGWFVTADDVLLNNGQQSGPWRRPARGAFGNIGRNTLFGPGFYQTDLSIFKTFQITERWSAQFRAETFNLFNNVNLAPPNTCVDCPGVKGRIFDIFNLAVQRQWQFALRLAF
ncbi:MAG: TonB-dependent receptor [Bryobacterales bacterium]|nr:TonB-dependent receptor [Bryobacteraceae bacterium]MDW8355449.1 TonB-dependent receptor [Bryobacterales bacterium]